jgi:flavin-dependent dehydrogenase
MELEADALVLGAGPAGCTTALNLARFMRVLVVDKGGTPGTSIGECLPAAVNRLLRDMRLYDSFVAQEHLPYRTIRSVWGDGAQWEQDEMRNLDGHGWYLDRRRFDTWLREIATQRGAAVITETTMLNLEQEGQDRSWRVTLERHGRPLVVRARFVVDASGRRALVGRRLGARYRRRDRLACGWIYGTDTVSASSQPGGSELHAEPDGWWYTSPLPRDGRILAFYTDADLPAARSLRSRQQLLGRAHDCTSLAKYLVDCGFQPAEQYGVCAAHSVVQESVVDSTWLAVGDAAMAFDPLSSMGLFNALYTGLSAADAIYHWHVSGDGASLEHYRKQMNGVWDSYMEHLAGCYRLESRWRDLPFWQRRAG